MSDTLAKLLASPDTKRPERDVDVCLAQGVPSQIGTLTQKVEDLEDEVIRLYAAAPGPRTADDDDSDKRPRKMAEKQDPRIDEVKAEIEQHKAEIARLNEVMREHTGKLTVAETIAKGEWRRWRDENPGREVGRNEHGQPIMDPYDAMVTRGYCNASALLDRLGDFVVKWDGEPLSEGQWEAVSAKAHAGDLKAAAREVVGIYEGDGAKALPKSWLGSSVTPTSDPS